MTLTSAQWRSFLARCMYKFFIDGTLKSYGVLLEDTTRQKTKYHFIAGWLFTLQIGACYLGSPLVGILQGSINRPLLAFLGGLTVGLGNVTFALMTSSVSTWQMFFLLAISGVGFGLLNIVTVLSLKDAFGQSYALAYSTTLLASSVGFAVMPLLLESLLRCFAKQEAMTIFSSLSCTLIVLGIILPSRYNCDEKDKTLPAENSPAISTKKVKTNDSQEHEKLLPALEGKALSPKKDFTSKKINLVKEERTDMNENKAVLSEFQLIAVFTNHPDLFVLLLLNISYDYIYSSWSIFLVPLGEFLGLKSDTAVWLSTVSGLSGFAGRLFCISTYYWSNTNLYTGLTLPYLLIAVSCLLTVFFKSFLWLAVAASLGGFGVAVLGNMTSTVIPACVCDKHFPVTVILVYTASGVAMQFGGIGTGAIVDVTGSYRIAFAVIVVISILQVALSIWWSCSSFTTKSRPPECKSLTDK